MFFNEKIEIIVLPLCIKDEMALLLGQPTTLALTIHDLTLRLTKGLDIT